MSIIPSAYYTLNPTAKTITFSTPYDSISAEEIVSIRNLSKQIEIYNSSDPRKHTSQLRQDEITQAFDISIADGVLTYIVKATMNTGDKIQISTNTSQIPSPNPVEYFFNNQTVAAGSTEVISDPIFTGDSSLLWYWISQTASADLVVTVYAESSETSTDRGVIKPYTLGTSLLSCSDFIEKCPPYIRVGVANEDTTNATNVTVKMRKTR